jgi:hypothetical protein
MRRLRITVERVEYGLWLSRCSKCGAQSFRTEHDAAVEARDHQVFHRWIAAFWLLTTLSAVSVAWSVVEFAAYRTGAGEVLLAVGLVLMASGWAARGVAGS